MSVDEDHMRQTLQRFCDEFLPALDCDGCTRFVAFMLENKGIPFEIYTGGFHEIMNPKNSFNPHYWIVTKQGTILDFKTEKWIGVKSIDVSYTNIRLVDKAEFLSVGGSRELVLGVILSCGVTAPFIIHGQILTQKSDDRGKNNGR